MKTLLKHLDLSLPGLEKVAAADTPSDAAAALLDYFRQRKTVRHPVDRSRKTRLRGRYTNAEGLQVADDAVKHIHIACPYYPRYFLGEDINWSHSPVPDKEWLWQLHRMSSWNSLASAYWHTGDEKYAKAWCEQLVDWVSKNPNDPEHDDAWRSIEAGIRGKSWMSHYQHFIDSPHFTPEVLTAFLTSCFDHADFLKDYGNAASNWALMEAEGLAFIALIFPEFKDAEHWLRKAFSTFHTQIKEQVRPDGHQIEQCSNYHAHSIRWFTQAPQLAKMNGYHDALPKDYWHRIEAMCEALMKLSLPDGMSTQFGDTSSQLAISAALKPWAAFFNRDDFRYVATHGKQGRAPEQTAYALQESGFYSLRNNWDPKAVCMVLKCGPGGYWHNQPDNGTFELQAFGRRLMPDSGTYIYSGDPDGRAWFRQTRVHQTLTLDQKDSDCQATCRLWQPGENLDTLIVENRSYKGLTHRRTVLFVQKKFFVLVDDAIGTATGKVDLHFQLAPGNLILDDETVSAQSDFDDANILVRAMPQPGMTLDKEDGQVSFHYGRREPRPAFRFRLHKTGRTPARFITLLVPYRGRTVPVASVEWLEPAKPGSKRWALRLSVGGVERRLIWDASNPEAGGLSVSMS
jgi:heparan-sulfate lyase